MPPIERLVEAAFRMPINNITTDRGVHILSGRIEAGTIKIGDAITIVPCNKFGIIEDIIDNSEHVESANAGWTVDLYIRCCNNLRIGDIICAGDSNAIITQVVIAQIVILELPINKPLITCGYTAVMHIHTCTVEICIEHIDHEKYLKNGSQGRVKIRFAKSVALEKFETNPQLGRFTIRAEGQTVAFGKILKIGIK